MGSPSRSVFAVRPWPIGGNEGQDRGELPPQPQTTIPNSKKHASTQRLSLCQRALNPRPRYPVDNQDEALGQGLSAVGAWTVGPLPLVDRPCVEELPSSKRSDVALGGRFAVHAETAGPAPVVVEGPDRARTRARTVRPQIASNVVAPRPLAHSGRGACESVSGGGRPMAPAKGLLVSYGCEPKNMVGSGWEALALTSRTRSVFATKTLAGGLSIFNTLA